MFMIMYVVGVVGVLGVLVISKDTMVYNYVLYYRRYNVGSVSYGKVRSVMVFVVLIKGKGTVAVM